MAQNVMPAGFACGDKACSSIDGRRRGWTLGRLRHLSVRTICIVGRAT
jgi:hypothetical protein